MEKCSAPGEGMVREINARVYQGKIEPLEKLDLKEGDEVTILVGKPAHDPEVFRAMLERTAGGWAGLLDVDAYLEDLYKSRHHSAPAVDLDK